MDRDTFVKRTFKAYQRLDYVNERYPVPLVECILIAIDFDNDVMNLRPLPNQITSSHVVEEKDFWCSIDYIEFPKKKLKIVM